MTTTQFPLTMQVNVIGAQGAPKAVLTLSAERHGQVMGEVLVERFVPVSGGRKGDVRAVRRRSSVLLSLEEVAPLMHGKGVMTSVFDDLHTIVPVKRA